MTRRLHICALAIVAGCALAAGRGAHSASGAGEAFSLRLDGRHLAVASTHWRAGAVEITATAIRGEQELSLLRFRTGYGYASFVADGRKADARGPAARAALARIMAGTEFLGGVDVFRGNRASFATVVRPGVYYLGELNDRPLFRVIHVAGTPSTRLPHAAAIITESDSGFRIPGGVLPARGTITIHNGGRQPHRVNLEAVESGTTRAEVGAYIRKSGGRPYGPPPPFARRGPEVGTALVGPGETIRFTYSVPAGTYALISWQEDARTGKPQALEGMYAVAKLR
jgi:hypothetical protein